MAEEKSASTTASSVCSGLFSRSSKPPSTSNPDNSFKDAEKESLNSNNNNNIDSTRHSLIPSYEPSSTGHEERFPKIYHAHNAEFVAELGPSLNYMDNLDPA